MGAKNRKTQRKINLLEMPDTEKVKVIEKLKQSLRQSINEAKLWNSLLHCDTVTINGQVVFSDDILLNGLYLTGWE